MAILADRMNITEENKNNKLFMTVVGKEIEGFFSIETGFFTLVIGKFVAEWKDFIS